MTGHLDIAGLTAGYDGQRVLDVEQLSVEKGEFLSVLGPSGCGKTTLLNVVAGFVAPTSGTVTLDGADLTGVPPHRRGLGLVFQNYALFPHMSVAQNVAYPLTVRKVPAAARAAQVARALAMVRLEGLSDRFPSQLSGGQQQRVALARALVFEPAVVLMDEPLGALDKQLREQMQLDIRALHKRLELTVVFVTHDQSEALTMSDRVAVFNQGIIEQIGSPRDIYDHPRSKFVAEFIGETNLLEGTVKGHDRDGTTIELDSRRQLTVSRSDALAAGARVLVSVRPERILLGPPSMAVQNMLPTKVLDSVYQGDHLRVQLDEAAFGLVVRLDRRSAEWPAGADVVAHFAPEDCWVVAA